MNYIKSPMNYIGNKYRLLKYILKLFPENSQMMVDLFCGGCDVVFNAKAKYKIANDINFFLIDIYKEFQNLGVSKSIEIIERKIKKWGLNKTDKLSYEFFRNYYNLKGNPLDLFTLMCFSFNYQFRFNSARLYNNPFGKNRSSFNETIRNNLISLSNIINDIEFSSLDFREFNYDKLIKGDFIYADPPYLISCGSYNDGKRGFKGWSEDDERDLYALLDDLNARGIKFVLSNVLTHKGVKNKILFDWATRGDYKIHELGVSYNNCNYQLKNRNAVTREVAISNY